MLSPTQGFTYNKFEKPSDWPDIKKTFDYQIENGKLLGANDYIELKGEVDYTSVGSPTIDNGIISNFSSSNYAYITDGSVINTTDIEMQIAGVLNNTTGDYKSGLSYYCGTQTLGALGVDYEGKAYWALTENITLVTNKVPELNTKFWLKGVLSNGTASLYYKTDNSAWELLGQRELSSFITYSNNIGIGTSAFISAGWSLWPGSIDLNETYIKIDNSLWFGKKYRRTEESNGVVTKSTIPVPEGLKIGNYTVPYNGMYDIISQTLVEDCSFYPINKTDTHFLPVDNNKLVGPVDYTVVGSPTIVDNVVSNFSSSNYLQTVSACKMNEITEFVVEIKKHDVTSSATECIMQLPGILVMTVEDDYYIIVYKTDQVDSQYFGDQIQQDVPLFIKVTNDGTNINFYQSSDGNTYTLKAQQPWSQYMNTTEMVAMFGYSSYGWPSALASSSINMKSTYIKVNNTLWFGRETWKPSIYDTNCMIELVGHTSDYSSYNNYGFTPTVSNGGTYNVWIDNQKVKENIASETATQLSWSDLALTTGYTVTTPSSLKAHIVKIEPSVDTNTLTGNLVTRVASSGIEPQGRLCQIIGTRDVFSLNRVSSSDGGVTSPVLKSLDSFTGELNSNTLVYSFYDTNLEHIPTIAMNGASSVYDGLGAFQQTKIKYVALKGTNTLKEASKFFDNPTLEKIDSENTLEFNTGDFGNNKKLKMLPKGTFVNSNYFDFLTQDNNLLLTNLDLSSNNTITKLDIYGTSDYRIDGLKSLLVSNEAPFTGTSPQINVSYTGLDRDALVDLFNSMPYNVGYTVIGSPTIVDGVMSGFSDSNYSTISTTFDLSKAWEIVINYDYGTVTPSTMGVLLGGRGHYFQWQVLTNGQISYAIDDKDGNTKYGFVEGLTTKENSFFKMVYDPTNKEITCYNGTNGLNWTQQGGANTADLTGCSCTLDIGSGVNSYATGFSIVGSVNFNNTRIKINNLLWFNGQVATTKSINITECTGTSDLTNDDKAIVTNKGWAITE